MFINTNTKHKIKLKNVVFWMLLLKMCILFGQDNSPKKVIIIDPGHGGKDTGAIGINGIQEKDIVLNIAKHMLTLNETFLNNSYNIYLTRYKDTLISLSDRSRLTKAIHPDIFISLHCNASKSIAKGNEVYIHNSCSSFTKESIALGLSILNESTHKLGFRKRGVKFADFQVLRETKAICPSSLVELGYVTNTDEEEYLLKNKNIRALALATLLGITNYIKTEL